MNSTARGFVQLGSGATAAKCTDGTVVSTSTLTSLICKCPTYAVDIAPCVCGATRDSSTTLTVSCAAQNLNDSAMAAVIVKIDPTTPLDTFLLNNNRLLSVPAGLDRYKQLANVNLANNSITAIGSTDLSTLTASVQLIDLSSNRITAIADGCFPGALNY